MQMINKNIFQSLVVLSILISSSAFSDASPFLKPEAVRLIPENTFIPSEFDDNDNVQLVISGHLPNICYKAGSASVQVDQLEKKIYIENSAYIYRSGLCAPVLVPYLHTINLGIVQAGHYQVLVRDQKDELQDQGILNVAASKTASSDNYLYAPVQDAFIQDLSQPTLTIRGQFESDCMQLQEIKVSYQSAHVIEILPIATMNQGDCHTVSVPFETQVKIEGPWSGSTLIYVRSLNGQAVSKVIDL